MTSVRISRRAGRAGRAGAAVALVAAALVTTSGTPANAGTNYWSASNGVPGNAKCGPTTQLQPGVYMQTCIQPLASSNVYSSFKEIMFITNRSPQKHYLQVVDSSISSDSISARGLRYHYTKDSGGCYTTAIYANQSLKCESGTVGFSNDTIHGFRQSVTARTHLAVSGKDWGYWFTPGVAPLPAS